MRYLGCRMSVGKFTSWLLWWSFVGAWIDVGVGEVKVKFGVLLPRQPVDRTKHPCTILPLAMAEQWLIAEDLAPLNWIVDSPSSKSLTRAPSSSSTAAVSAQFEYSNTNCSDTYGPNAAMEIYYRGTGCQADDESQSASVQSLRVFYGPCCKYALSPVGRLAGLWNVPLITPGGLTSGFGREEAFSTLTRFVAPYQKMAEFVPALLARYDWWHLFFLYHDNIGADSSKGFSMCSDIMDAIRIQIHRKSKGASLTTTDEDNVTTTSSGGQTQQNKYYMVFAEDFNQNYVDPEEDLNAIMGRVRNASRGECL